MTRTIYPEAREWFEHGLAELEAHREASPLRDARNHPTTIGFTAAIVAAGEAKRGPKPKGSRRRALDFDRATDLLTDEEVATIRAPFARECEAILDAWNARCDQIEDALRQAAPLVELRPCEPSRVQTTAIESADDSPSYDQSIHHIVVVRETDADWFGRPESDPSSPEIQWPKFAWKQVSVANPSARLLDRIWGSSYSTQGFGAATYARAAAEQIADVPRLYNVETEVRCVERESKSPPHASPDFEVWVSVESETDVELLRRLPGPTLREQIRLCWARGVNPRVYNPFLPHGIEEKLDLNYFGGDTADSPYRPKEHVSS